MARSRYELLKLPPAELSALAGGVSEEAHEAAACLQYRLEVERDSGELPYEYLATLRVEYRAHDGIVSLPTLIRVSGEWTDAPSYNKALLLKLTNEVKRQYRTDKYMILSLVHDQDPEYMAHFGLTRAEFEALEARLDAQAVWQSCQFCDKKNPSAQPLCGWCGKTGWKV